MQIKYPISVLLTTVSHINSSVCSSSHLRTYTCLFVDVTCTCSTRWGQCVTAVMPSLKAAWRSAHHGKTLPAHWDWNERLFWSIISSYCIHQGEHRGDGRKHSHIRWIIHAGCGFLCPFLSSLLHCHSQGAFCDMDCFACSINIRCAVLCSLMPANWQPNVCTSRSNSLSTNSCCLVVLLLFFVVHYFCLF